MPWVRNAPKLWPAEPLNLMWMVCSGSPACPYFLATAPASMAPTERSVLAMVYSREISFPFSMASRAAASMVTSFTWAMSCFCSMTWCMAAPLSTRCSSLLKSSSEDFFSLGACCISIRSVRPMISSNWVNPISARYSRTSCARKVK